MIKAKDRSEFINIRLRPPKASKWQRIRKIACWVSRFAVAHCCGTNLSKTFLCLYAEEHCTCCTPTWCYLSKVCTFVVWFKQACALPHHTSYFVVDQYFSNTRLWGAYIWWFQQTQSNFTVKLEIKNFSFRGIAVHAQTCCSCFIFLTKIRLSGHNVLITNTKCWPMKSSKDANFCI